MTVTINCFVFITQVQFPGHFKPTKALRQYRVIILSDNCQLPLPSCLVIVINVAHSDSADGSHTCGTVMAGSDYWRSSDALMTLYVTRGAELLERRTRYIFRFYCS
jgi:hypothetical protein